MPRIGIGLGLIPTAARPPATTAPVNVGKPFFAGILTQGQSADANPGSWTGLPSPNFDYAIKRSGVTVSTDPDYVWTADDVAAGVSAMTVEVTATNEIGPTSAESDPVTIAALLQLSGTPGEATVGDAYSFIPNRTGGHGPFSFALDGTLPPGLMFNTSSGTISGTPVASGTAALSIEVTDANGLTAQLGPFDLDVTSDAGVTLPATRTTLMPAETPIGRGGDDNGYAGALWLAVHSQDGVETTGNPYTAAASSSNKFRINKENKLVFRGNVTGTYTLPTGLNASYTLAIREYPTEADAIARTNWTGQEQIATVFCTGDYELPAVSGVDSHGDPIYWPAKTIDLGLTAAVCNWPRTTTSERYPSGYTATNETLLETNSTFQMSLLSGHVAMGHFILMRPCAFNKPYFDGVHEGTVDLDIRINYAPTGTWSGTAPEFADGNFLTILMEDPLRTNWNFAHLCGSNTRITRGYFNIERATLNRTTFANLVDPTVIPDTASNSSSAIGALQLFVASGTAYSFLRVDGNVFDPQIVGPLSEPTNANTACAIYGSIATGVTTASHDIAIVDNYISGGYDGISMGCSSTVGGPGYNICVARNRTSGHQINDGFSIRRYYAHRIYRNLLIGSTTPFGAHPDYIDINWTSMPANSSFEFGYIEDNILIGGSDATDEIRGQGVFWNGTPSTTWGLNGRIKNNVYIGSAGNGTYAPQCDGFEITNNICLYDNVIAGGDPPGINLGTNTKNSLIARNVVRAAAGISIPAGRGNTGADNIGNITPANAATYFQTPAYGAAVRTREEAIAAWKAKVGGPLDGTAASGKTIGAYEADGSIAA